MALNPVERKDLILSAMPAIAGGIASNEALLQAIAHAHSRGSGPDRKEAVAILAYDEAVALADKYDLENP